MYKSHGKEYIENNFTPAELQALVKSAPSPPTTMTSPPAQRAGPLSSKKMVPQAPLEFNCKMCGSKFLTKTKLMQHMQSHGVSLSYSEKQLLNRTQKDENEHKAKLHPVKKRKPGPASKTNAPPECRGITSLPTYLQLTQVSRRSSACSEVNKPAQQATQATNEAGAALTALISQLTSAAAAKAPNERQACNFCNMVCTVCCRWSASNNRRFKSLKKKKGKT